MPWQSKSDEQVLVENCHKTETCWLWTGAVHSSGYGMVCRRNRKKQNVTVHRLAYEVWVGPIPEGKNVCHHCDVKTCIRPDHLFAGTTKENNRDCWRKGRHQPIVNSEQARANLSRAIKRNIAEGRVILMRDAATGQVRGWRRADARPR